MDGHHVRNLSTSVTPRRTRTACAFALAQQRNELAAQLSSRISVDGRVDALMRDIQAGIFRMHAPECAGNLLRRPPPGEHGAHDKPQAAIAVQLGQRSSANPSLLAHVLSGRAGVGASADIAPELTADGARAASQQLCHAAHAPALLVQRRQCRSLFRLQVRVCRSHLRTLLRVGILHFDFEAASNNIAFHFLEYSGIR